jgi:hypothetical protein
MFNFGANKILALMTCRVYTLEKADKKCVHTYVWEPLERCCRKINKTLEDGIKMDLKKTGFEDGRWTQLVQAPIHLRYFVPPALKLWFLLPEISCRSELLMGLSAYIDMSQRESVCDPYIICATLFGSIRAFLLKPSLLSQLSQ